MTPESVRTLTLTNAPLVHQRWNGERYGAWFTLATFPGARTSRSCSEMAIRNEHMVVVVARLFGLTKRARRLTFLLEVEAWAVVDAPCLVTPTVAHEGLALVRGPLNELLESHLAPNPTRCHWVSPGLRFSGEKDTAILGWGQVGRESDNGHAVVVDHWAPPGDLRGVKGIPESSE